MFFIKKNGRPVEALVALACRHGVEADKSMSAEQLSTALQERWLRQTSHQYQVPGGPPESEDHALLRALELLDAFGTPPGDYTGALVLGATLVGVRKRLAHLVEQHRLAVKTETVFLLGGARKLDHVREGTEMLTTPAELRFREGWQAPPRLPTTEAEMMQFVFDQSQVPPQWSSVLIATPLQPTPDGRMRPPNTTDTVTAFMTTAPKAGRYLAVSSQPFVCRQTLNVRRAVPPDFTIIGIGHSASPTTPLQTFLDEAARLLFEELTARRQ